MDLLDFTIYLDISDDIKFAWKVQRDMQERGHSLESIKESIEARKPDFDAYVAPQRSAADIIVQVLPTLLMDDKEGKYLRVKMIQRENKENFDPVYLFDEGSTIEWTPCGKKLTCSYPGIKFAYGPDSFLGNDVTVLEMDGKFDNLQELIYVESHLSNTATKFYGELTQQMVKMGDSPGSDNGTGFFQTSAAAPKSPVVAYATAPRCRRDRPAASTPRPPFHFAFGAGWHRSRSASSTKNSPASRSRSRRPPRSPRRSMIPALLVVRALTRCFLNSGVEVGIP